MVDEKQENKGKKFVFNEEEAYLLLHSLNTDEEVALSDKVSRGIAKMRLATAIQAKIQVENDTHDTSNKN